MKIDNPIDLVHAIDEDKNLIAQIKELEAKRDELQSQINDLEAQVNERQAAELDFFWSEKWIKMRKA